MSNSGLKTASVLCALAVLLLGTGCLPPAPLTPLSVKKSVLLPSMKNKSQDGVSQERGGLVLELAALAFDLKERTTTKCSLAGTIRDHNGTPLYDLVRETELVAKPMNLEFKLKISNHSKKIVKLSDVLFKLIVDGKEAPLKADEIKEATLRPDDSKEYLLVGPAWQTFPKQTSVALSVYGVPTEFDAANNVKKTENFDWTFDYEVSSVEKEAKLEHDSQYLTDSDLASVCRSSDEDQTGAATPQASGASIQQ